MSLRVESFIHVCLDTVPLIGRHFKLEAVQKPLLTSGHFELFEFTNLQQVWAEEWKESDAQLAPEKRERQHSYVC